MPHPFNANLYEGPCKLLCNLFYLNSTKEMKIKAAVTIRWGKCSLNWTPPPPPPVSAGLVYVTCLHATRGATYKSILKVLLKQYRSPTNPNKFKSATIISVDNFQITMRHDLDRWPFDPKINRAHPWLMVSKCMKFHDHRLITESVIVRKPFSNNHAPWPWPLTFWPQNQ